MAKKTTDAPTSSRLARPTTGTTPRISGGLAARAAAKTEEAKKRLAEK
jgi:hypothetical protein